MRCTRIFVVLALAIGCAPGGVALRQSMSPLRQMGSELIHGSGLRAQDQSIRQPPPVVTPDSPATARESPPEFSYDLYSDEQGHFSHDGTALALVKRPSHLQRVYAEAARGEARPIRLIQEIEEFLGNSPEGVRLREVLAEAYASRAHQLGVRNDVTIAGVNLLLVGSLAKAVLARAGVVAEAKAAGGGLGKAISEGHAFEKHVVKAGEFKGFGIKTPEDFARHIDGVVAGAKGPNVRELTAGRTAYWDDATGTVVIRNPSAPDMGTAFQPTLGKKYFTDVLK